MIHKDPDVPDVNLIGKNIADFIEYYNQNIPEAFPPATRKVLEVFKETYPSLFKGSGEWVIEKHRKKLMDWMSSYHMEGLKV